MRTPSINRPLAIAALSLAGLGLLGACGNADSVEKDKVAKLAEEQLTGIEGDFSVTCPEDIKTEEGASMECTIVLEDGSEVPMTATIESIEGSTAHFNFSTGTGDGTGDGDGGTDTGS